MESKRRCASFRQGRFPRRFLRSGRRPWRAPCREPDDPAHTPRCRIAAGQRSRIHVRTCRRRQCPPDRARPLRAHSRSRVEPCRDVKMPVCRSDEERPSPSHNRSRTGLSTRHPPRPRRGQFRVPARIRSVYSSSFSCSARMNPRLVSQSSTTEASLSLVYWAMFDGRMVTVLAVLESVNFT